MENIPIQVNNQEWYEEIIVENWIDIQKKAKLPLEIKANKENKKWVFRGDKETTEVPTTGIEKVFDLYGISNEKDKKQYEIDMIREFQRKASLYIHPEPDKDDIVEWLSVMRHHGAPTRLLDCSYSFYVALYFALANNKMGTVWAINTKAMGESKNILERLEKLFDDKRLRAKYENFKNKCQSQSDVLNIRDKGEKTDDLLITLCLFEVPVPMVYPVNPFKLNKRLTSQQGMFLILGDSALSFKENIKEAFGNGPNEMKQNIYKIVFKGTPEARKEILRELKNMNITNETLFPGIDGFAKSTEEIMARPILYSGRP